MKLIWRDVFIPHWVIDGDGFPAEVGGTVHMALELYCHYWTTAADNDRPGPITVHPGAYHHPDFRSTHELVGVAVPTEAVWCGGWMFDVAGLLLYVTPAPDPDDPEMAAFHMHMDPQSQPGDPSPSTMVRVKGQLSVAEAHVTGGFEPQETLLQRATRTWSVQRIVRLSNHGQHHDVPATERWDHDTTAYLLDIAEVEQPAHPAPG